MGVKERILAIRLMDKIAQHPIYAKKLGVEILHAAENASDADLDAKMEKRVS